VSGDRTRRDADGDARQEARRAQGRGINLSAWALRNPALTLFAILAVAVAGAWAYMTLGRAEDPSFTIKQMIVQVDWPGASAGEVARAVADRIERKLEELPDIDYTESTVQPGRLIMLVSLKDTTPPGRVADLWYQVRKKIFDIAPTLPQGVQGPYFNDEFGDVFGIVYAFTGDGFTLPELRHVVEDVRERLLAVPGVGKIQLLGDQEERLFVDLDFRKLAELGLTVPGILEVIARENAVAAGGFADTQGDRVFVRTGPGVNGVAMLRALPVAAHGRTLALGDIAAISRGTADPPEYTMRANGQPAVGLAVSMATGGNILDLGKRISARMAEIMPSLPLGVTAVTVNDQPEVVAADVGVFEESFLEALAIVLLVSFISLGWRTGIVVAVSVPLVLAGTLVGMRLLGIDLQRISLGAMIVALGLLVDDAIIAVETMVVKLEQGWDRYRAGSFAYTSTAFPMLTGTLVTAAGYLPIGLAQSSTGEYTRDLFVVVGMSLILSWLVAVLFVPYLGAALLPAPRLHAPGADPEAAVYDTRFYRAFRRVVRACIERRFVVIGATVLAFAVSVAGFALVPRQFFPASDRREVIVEMRLPEGASFGATQAAVARVEAMLKSQPGIRSFSAYTGTGVPRFMLSMAPQLDSANYAQLVVNTESTAARDALIARLEAAADDGAADGFGDIRMRASGIELGPPVGYPVQFRILGPDPDELRRIAAEVRQAMRANPHMRNVNDDWGNLGKSVRIAVDQDKARRLGLSGQDIAATVQTLLQGTVATQYREGTDLIPVVARATEAERRDLSSLPQASIRAAGGQSVPLSQIASVSPVLEEATLVRRNRLPSLTVRGEIADGMQAPEVTAQMLPALAPIIARLPGGYRIETGGTVEESGKGQDSVNAGVPVMVLAMLALLMAQMRSFGRMALVIVTAPLGLIGVTAALLVTGRPFGFVAMLGCIALAGIIMRNSVILVDQIQRDLRDGRAPADAIVSATVRRARPILLTAAAAICALVPLSLSVFWGPMAIAIMGGLVAATLLTLCFVPALYAAWTGVPRQATASHARAAAARAAAQLQPGD
jgi:multidrug efflux pump